MAMLDDLGLGVFDPVADFLAGPQAVPEPPMLTGKGDRLAAGKADRLPLTPNARVANGFSPIQQAIVSQTMPSAASAGTFGSTAAQPLPPQQPLPDLGPAIDVASMPVASVNSEVASPFDLGVGQTGTLADAQLPPNATPTVGIGAPQTAPQPVSQPDVPQSSLAGRLFGGAQDWINNHRATLMALGSGMAGAQNLGQGLQRAGQLTGPALQQDIQQQRMNATVQALVRRGMDPNDAVAAASNPSVLQQIMPRLFGAKQWQLGESTDMFGQKKPFLYDPVSGETRALNVHGSGGGLFGGGVAGAGAGAGSGAAAASPAASGQRMTLDNFDMANVDPNVQGWDYLKQYPVEVENAAKEYMAGGVMPTGNPRNQGIANVAKMAAQKVAMDVGQPQLADDTTFAARRTMRDGLTKSAPGSTGGQITYAGTSLTHLAEAAEDMVALQNSSGLGIAPLARMVNNARGMTTDQAAKVNQLNGDVQHYGQEITKYYTGSPGGEAERMRFLNSMDAAKSPQELAAAVRAERNLIPGRQSQLQEQIQQTLGDWGVKQFPVLRGDARSAIPRIDAALAKLDPTGPEAQAQRMAQAGALRPAQGAPAAPKVPIGQWVQVSPGVRIRQVTP